MTETGRILALDYGTRKVGVALTDALQITAAPYLTIRYESRTDLMRQIQDIIEDREIVEIVVGVPIGLSGEDTKFTTHVREFITELKAAVTQPVHNVDERFTSADAKASLIQMGIKTGHNKEKVDAMAAAHLLRYYLDLREAKGTDS